MVDDDGLCGGRDGLIPVEAVAGRGAQRRCRLWSVIEGTSVHHHAVPLDDEGGDMDELEPGVGLDGQLGERVGIEGQSPAIVARLSFAEPHSGSGVEAGLIRNIVAIHRRIVGVRALGMEVPRSLGAHLAVGVGEQDVSLAGGVRCEAEGNVR